MQDNIPVTGPQPSEGKPAPELEAETASEPAEAAEVEPVEPEKIHVQGPAAEGEAEDEDEVQGQVMLAVKVTKKQRTPSERDLAAKADYAPRYSTPTRRPAERRPASFNPLAWMADGVSGAIEEVRHNDLGLSQEFWTHLYAVRRESLLTARALVESLIAKVESKGDQQEDRAQRRQRRGSVNIDF